MKNNLLCLFVFLGSGCDKKGVPTRLPAAVSVATASQAQCPTGGTVVKIPGEADILVCNGADGKTGAQGIQGRTGNTGTGIVFTTTAASPEQCPNGGTLLLEANDDENAGTYSLYDSNQHSALVCNGANGQVGAQGNQGEVGIQGETGAQGIQGNTGAAGTDGKDAPVTAFTIVNPITPCGPDSSAYKEILLCLADGQLLADFSKSSDGDLTRLAFIPVGSYQDTDNSACAFSVASDGAGGLTVSWSAQHGNLAGSTDCQKTTGN